MRADIFTKPFTDKGKWTHACEQIAHVTFDNRNTLTQRAASSVPRGATVAIPKTNKGSNAAAASDASRAAANNITNNAMLKCLHVPTYPKRTLIEFCCGPESRLGQTEHIQQAKGCTVIRVTLLHDVTTSGGLKFVMDIINNCDGPTTYLWASMPTAMNPPRIFGRLCPALGKAKIEEHGKVFNRIFAAFVVCARSLAAKGGHIINEWPTGCEYWRKPKVHKTFAKLQLNHAVLIHGCALGLKSVAVKDHYIKKPWKLRASFPHMSVAFEDATCPGVDEFHKHTPCAGIDTKLSEEYTPKFVLTAHLGILAHARTYACEGTKTPFSGSSSDACTNVVVPAVANDIAHDKLVDINISSHVCTPRLADPVPTKVSLRSSVNINNTKRVSALPAIIKTMNLKHVVCACVVSHTSSTMASHSHADGSGRETEDDDMRDIWPNAIDESTSSSSAAPAVAASGSDTTIAEPDIDTIPLATTVEALCIDPVGSDAPSEDSRMPRSPAEPPAFVSSRPSDEELAKRQANLAKLRTKIDDINAERTARGLPLPVAAAPPHRATVEEQQAVRDRLAVEKATAFANRKKNLAEPGTPILHEKRNE